MSGPVNTNRRIAARASASDQLRLALAAALSATVGAFPVRAADCPQPVVAAAAQEPATDEATAPSDDSPEDQQIEFEADAVEARRDGEMLLKGDVVISQG